MRIAVLSGKGGTGKTLVSVNLASAAQEAVYLDCDVEEPNGHLFFKPEGVVEEEVKIMLPAVDGQRCAGCRKCVDFCKFNALAFVKNKPYIFDEVCHSCGGCIFLCPQQALTEREKDIGVIQKGMSGQVTVCTGILHPGEASGVPIIKKLLRENRPGVKPVFIDCPPGSACIVMESIREADYCILVAEPTLFGVHNLRMVHDLVRLFQKPYGVILNKCLDGENPSERYCREEGIRILGQIPFDSRLGALNADSKIAVREDPAYYEMFDSLLRAVMGEVRHEANAHSQR